MTVFRLGLVLALCVLWSLPSVDAREYNKRPPIAPQTRAKIDRVLARERAKRATAGTTVVRGDVVNTGCGDLTSATSRTPSQGRKWIRTVVMTGDVINVARCR